MLFTSPSFLFLFLPAILAVYALVPTAYRRYALVIFNLLYYILACRDTPISILLVLLNAAITYSAGYVIAVTHQRGTLIAAILIDAAAFFAYRVFYAGPSVDGGFYYPFGASVYLLASISYLVDIYRSDAPHAKNIGELLLYQLFFPVLIVGPVIKYKHFCAMINDDGDGGTGGISFSLANFSEGIKHFIGGFLGRVGIAAVLSFTVDRLMEETAGNFGLGIALFCLLLLLVQAYFSFAGYADMARGIMYMLGLPHASDFCFPLRARHPVAFVCCLFSSVGHWISDYLIRPLNGLHWLSPLARTMLGDCIFFVAFVFWFRVDLYLLLPVLPILIWQLCRRLSAARHKPGERMGRGYVQRLRVLLFRIVVLLCTSLFLAMIAVGNPTDLMEYLHRIGRNAFGDQSYSIALSFMYLRYLVIGAAGLCFLMPLGQGGERIFHKMSPPVRTAGSILSLCIVMFAFAFTIVHFLPQFPELGMFAFHYLIL